MDLVTQGVLGATMASAGARAGEIRAAAVVGVGAGLLADADALIRSPSDPLLVFEVHRHFTHAIAFVPIGATIAALAFAAACRIGAAPVSLRALPFSRIAWYALLGYALSGVLDACTSYGTRLLWPFSDARIAWNVVSIVDPAFTLLLAVPLALALVRQRPGTARIGLALAAAYLAAGAVQGHRAESAARSLAASRGHVPERLVVKPTIANILLWRALYSEAGTVHAAAIRAGVDVRAVAGDSAELVAAGERVRLEPEPGVDALARFAALSEGWLVRDPRAPARFGDARYAMVPTRLLPLWGIDLSGDVPVTYTDRSMSPVDRERFVDLLLGRRAVTPVR